MTEWRAIPGWPEYQASDDGQIRRAKQGNNWPAGRVLKPQAMPNGYLCVHLYRANRRRSIGVHRLVCAAFHEPAPTSGHEAAHFDGNKTNNSAANLRWATKASNAADRARHGTNTKGEQQSLAKLTAESVREIRRRAQAGALQKDLAREFGTSQQTISRAIQRQTWSHIS